MTQRPRSLTSPFFLPCLALAAVGLASPGTARAGIVPSGGGLVLAEEAGTFAAGNLSTMGGTAFALDIIAGGALAPTHTIANVNNGSYGNGSSWIGDSPNSWVGVAFGSSQSIQSIAFGRDNTNSFGDRNLGVYTLQYTTDAGVLGNPGGVVWNTIGSLDYQSAGGNAFYPNLRHRYNFTEVMGATGIRLIAPTGAAIDEIEVYGSAGSVIPAQAIITTSAPGFSVSWNGNDGDFFNPAVPATVPNNLALSGTAFASAELGGPHVTAALNDGLYGNSNSWIGGPPNAQAGINLGGLFNLTSLAFGRDNGNGAFDRSVAGTDACGGQCDDRFAGLYTLEVTTDGVNWTTVGTVTIGFNEDPLPGGGAPGGGVTPYLRHQFDLALAGGGEIMASGVRITGSTAGIGIDEIEIYGAPVPEPTGPALLALGLLGCALRRRR